jgi:mannose-6-phosphate isomerase-like protein (cupin superfamily)
MEARPKTWGREIWIVNNDHYCAKFLHFNQFRNCSLHCHHNKTETFYVLEGVFDVLIVDTLKHSTSKLQLHKGQTLDIPKYQYHSMKGLERRNVLLEISTHHEDKDSFVLSKEEAEMCNMEEAIDEYVVWKADVAQRRQMLEIVQQYLDLENHIAKNNLWRDYIEQEMNLDKADGYMLHEYRCVEDDIAKGAAISEDDFIDGLVNDPFVIERFKKLMNATQTQGPKEWYF